MIELVSQPWPWYVAGPLIGLTVPLLYWIGGKRFGVSSSFRHMCAAAFPGRSKLPYLNYDWQNKGMWNLVLVLGVFIGGLIASTLLASPDPVVGISEATRADLAALGVTQTPGLHPTQFFSWEGLATLPGFVMVVLGGFLVGFGARYADGCTSGHAITGLATLQISSLIAVLGFFAGGLFVTFVVLPLLLG
jgi:uncharacterized membrane protein YedE/YeeE